jgi:hypothetical protein
MKPTDPFKDLDKRSRLALRQALQDRDGSGAAPSAVVKKLERQQLVRRSGHMYEAQEWGKVVRRWPVFSLTDEGTRIAREIVTELATRTSADHSTIKRSPAQLDAEIAETLATRRTAVKRDPKIVMIEGEPWRVERQLFWVPNTGGGLKDRAWNFVRLSDGRTMTSSDKDRGLRIIAERIRKGTYAGPPKPR